ncbi:aminotransferase class I/II-fold pyridoxal phosphate-dependent enzyme [Allobaculum stercoricanis]|uniref:pyridoxal phosphate-dependent aminotransferase n=1 Tax=Allobaculum stercoricanis TaxID=174709 RepID=UPI002942C32B|nr:aminotransferase class I/II-fold pyridoxal phosphate-dependent enzyme [Allobaculum stercoricanis]
MQIADRMNFIQNSVFANLRKDKEQYEQQHHQQVLDFTLGSPNIPPAPNVIQTLSNQAQIARNYRYAVDPLNELIDAISEWYFNRYQVRLTADEICLLQGSQEALVNLPLLYCNPGDGILVQNPYYPAYVDAPHIAQADILFMPLKEEHDYLIDFDAISPIQRQKAKMMIVCYPNNPTGATAPDWFIEKLIRFAKENDILVIYDNAYSDLIFDGSKGKSFLSFDGAKEVGIELNSFSKSYGMAGARLGVMVGNETVIAQYRKLKSNLDYGVFLPVQYAGIEALQTGSKIVEQTRQTYIERRQLLQQEFSKAGWAIELTKATMFIWAQIPEEYDDSYAFAKDLLFKTGVLVTPGLAFGQEGKRYVRLALVTENETICQAAKRFEQTQFFHSLTTSD